MKARCDICMTESDRITTLHDQYRAHDVNEVCETCVREIEDASTRAHIVARKIVTPIVHRMIAALLRRHAP